MKAQDSLDPVCAAILERLDTVERSDGVRILYACESGSRAWGFPSRDADYDVRFIYLRPRDWYLSIDIETKRDVIELPIDGLLDINGWDLRKALKLLRKLNPALLEWLSSPVVYREQDDFADALINRVRDKVPLASCAYHYLHMARGNFRGYLQGDTVKVKKYLYVLRPLLAVRWIEQHGTLPPVLFRALLDGVLNDGPIKREVEEMLRLKTEGLERDEGPRIAIVHEYCERELGRLQNPKFSPGNHPAAQLDFDALFLDFLARYAPAG